jgi:hypothetical protein
MIALCCALISVYVVTVVYRARLMSVPKFCQNVKRCRWKHHRVVIVAPPNKPARAVLKHV